eukprot:813696_1
MLSRDRFIMAPTNKPFVITIVHMLLAQISGQCCAYDEYCVSDSNGYDPNYAYYGISDGCKYFKSVSSTNVLHRTSSNWILSSNIKDDSTSYRVCSQFHLDYCTEGTWTSPRGTSYPSMTVNKCTSTPSSTYPRAELIAIIIVAMVFLLGIIGTLLFLKRTYKKAEGKEDLKIVVEAPGDINAHPNELKNVEGWGFTYQMWHLLHLWVTMIQSERWKDCCVEGMMKSKNGLLRLLICKQTTKNILRYLLIMVMMI